MEPIQRSDSKALNKALVFKTIAINGPISRIELSKQTKLSKMTITNFVSELISDGYVEELGTSESENGRKPILLDIAPARPLVIAIQITRHYVIGSIVNFKGKLLHTEMTTLYENETKTSIFAKFYQLIDALPATDYKDHIVAIGASSMGSVSPQLGTVNLQYYMHNLPELSIPQAFSCRYGLPAFLDNDLNVLAIAEKYYGNARPYQSFAVIGSSIGLGCGIVINSQPHRGGLSFGPEIGHVTVHADGPQCYCGNVGCLELYGSIPATVEYVRKLAEQKGVPTQVSNWNDLLSAARDGDPLSLAAIDRMVDYLSMGIVTLINLFEPECILLGEDLTIAHDLLASKLEKIVNARKFSNKECITKILPSHFAGPAPIIGPAALAIDSILNDLFRS